MKLADSGLNPQAEAIEETQTVIRRLVRDGYLADKPKATINAEIQRSIRRGLKAITNPELRDAAARSLNAFAERQYTTYLREFGATPYRLLAIAALVQNKPGTPQFEKAAEGVQSWANVTYEPAERGVALQKYSRDYFRENISPVLDRVAQQNALDPDDVSGRNSLRNRAEMEVRYARHLDEIEQLRAAGVKLVTSSVHADCSDRCAEWQGRVYSLDGTSGTTEDGKSYVPLEKATDVYYTTKAGKTYKNGLFGFNCRHYLMVYKPHVVIPQISAERRKKENAINNKQRELERRVRDYRARALEYKDLDREKYLAARKQAIAANKEYIKFSKDNGRAYYPSRVQIL